MIGREDLELVFQAWYDHKMEPENPEFLRLHRSSMDSLKSKMETLLGYPITTVALRQSIGARFGAWMTENGLPKPPK
jgi:hypothetical protein